MLYCGYGEVREMIKEDALNSIIGDTFIEDKEEREMKIKPIIENAILDAEGEIDGYISKRYTVPLASVPRVISKFAKDIAVYNLYSRTGIDESDKEKTYLNRYNSAIAFLKMVTEGKIDIGAEAGGGNSAEVTTGFSVKSSVRLFSRDSLGGM